MYTCIEIKHMNDPFTPVRNLSLCLSPVVLLLALSVKLCLSMGAESLYVHMYVYIFMYVFFRICMNIYLYTYVCAYFDVYVHIYFDIYIDACTHR